MEGGGTDDQPAFPIVEWSWIAVQADTRLVEQLEHGNRALIRSVVVHVSRLGSVDAHHKASRTAGDFTPLSSAPLRGNDISRKRDPVLPPNTHPKSGGHGPVTQCPPVRPR